MLSDRKNIAKFAVLIIAFIVLLPCNAIAYLPPYFAYVDRIEPEISGLVIKATRGGGGELFIENNCGEDVIIYNETGESELYNITTRAVYVNRSGNWRLYSNGSATYFHEWIEYMGPETKEPGTVVKTWKIYGRVNQTNFTIYGRTVYEPDWFHSTPWYEVMGYALLGFAFWGAVIAGVTFLTIFIVRKINRRQIK